MISQLSIITVMNSKKVKHEIGVVCSHIERQQNPSLPRSSSGASGGLFYTAIEASDSYAIGSPFMPLSQGWAVDGNEDEIVYVAGRGCVPARLCHRSQRSLYFPFFASTSIHTLTPARKRAAVPWYVSALCEMNGGSVSLHLLTGGGRGCRRGGMRQTEIYIYSAHKYFAKISVLCVLKKCPVSAMMETQKEKPL